MTSLRPIVAIVAALVLIPALSACGANPLQEIVKEATGGTVDLGGASVPEDFPAAVPLYDGPIVTGVGLGTAPAKIWTVVVAVPDVAAVDSIRAQLVDAGFAEEIGHTAAEAGGAAFSNAEFGVVVTLTADGNSGFIASYVVSPRA